MEIGNNWFYSNDQNNQYNKNNLPMKENNISFMCIYEVKDFNETIIINTAMNQEIFWKIKILNGDRKENLVFKKRFNKIGINVINFIIEQAEDFFETDKDYTIRQLDTLKGLKYDDLINVSKEKRISSFHFFDGYSYICNDINYIDKQCKDIYCDIISFICDGKVFFESCYDIFTYLRNRIIKSSNNPIRTATVVTMIG